MPNKEAQGCGEGKNQRQRTMPCEIRPIVMESPQERGLGMESGDKPKDEDKNVPYKKTKTKLPKNTLQK